MTFPRARLVVSACLFVSWIGFLSYLAIEMPAVIVSRPQFLQASLYVAAEIREEHGRPNPQIAIKEVLWTANPKDKNVVPNALTIPELTACRKPEGYRGPGTYLLPLVKREDGEYEIAPIPIYADYYPAAQFGTVEMWEMGDQPAKVLRCLVQFAGWEKEETEKLLKKQWDPPLVVCRKVEVDKLGNRLPPGAMPVWQAYPLKKMLVEAGAKRVFVREEELKIYPLTSSTRTQVDEIIQSKQ